MVPLIRHARGGHWDPDQVCLVVLVWQAWNESSYCLELQSLNCSGQESQEPQGLILKEIFYQLQGQRSSL